MLPTDSIEKPKIKTKTEKSYGAEDQLLGESIEKQRNGTRLKFSPISHDLQGIWFQNSALDFSRFLTVLILPCSPSSVQRFDQFKKQFRNMF